MRLALLGLDETTVALARAAHNNGRDELVLFCDFERAEKLDAIVSLPLQPQSWEILLAGGPGGIAIFDAVLVAREAADDDRRLEQLRKLVQAGVPMLLAHPVHSSMLAYYELDMIRRESGCVMVPFLPLRQNPLVGRLKNLIEHQAQSELGQVDQILVERSLPDAARETVAAEFARDADLLQFLGGEIVQLGAMALPLNGRSKTTAVYTNLGVQMTTSSGRLLRWWVAPTLDSWSWRVVVSGHTGKATLTLPSMRSSKAVGSCELQLETKTGATSHAPDVVEWNPYESSLDELREALSQRELLSRWPNAARSIELAETLERSLAKGRTIDLHDQEFSDTATFKGLMTSVGCLLLLFALGATVVAAVVANLLKHAGALGAAQVVGSLPYVFLGLFCLFLAVQFLLKLVQPSGGSKTGGRTNQLQEHDDKV